MVPWFRVWYEDDQTFDAGYSFSAPADLFDINVVFLAFLDWFRTEPVRTTAATIASPFITHSVFHLRSSFLLVSVATGEISSRFGNGHRTFSGESTLDRKTLDSSNINLPSIRSNTRRNKSSGNS